MTWKVSNPNPLITYPAVGLSNPGFETAFAGSDWTATGAAARDTSVFHSGIASCKFTPAASTGKIEQTKTLAAITGWKSTGLEPWYVYFWARNDSKTATPSFTITVEMRDNAHALVASQFSPQNFVLGTDITTDTTFRLYRAGPFTPVNYSTVTEMYCKFSFETNSTAVLYIDDVQLCHALDFQDLGPSNYGARAHHPFPYMKEYDLTSNVGVAGKFFLRRRNAGMRRGVIESTNYQKSDKTKVDNFMNYCMDGTPFQLFHDQTDLTRDYIAKAVLDQDDDGTNPVDGMDSRSVTIGWVEAA